MKTSITPLQKRQLEIVVWEVNNRTKLNRAMNGPGCTYDHKFNGGCAIGRLLDPELAEELGGRNLTDAWEELPPHIQELEEPFLQILQRIHDDMFNFNFDGLNSYGLEQTVKLLICQCVFKRMLPLERAHHLMATLMIKPVTVELIAEYFATPNEW